MDSSLNTHGPQAISFPTETGQQILTTVFIANLHCNSCSQLIQTTLNNLHPPPESIAVSILTHSVSIVHSPSLLQSTIVNALDTSGFEIHSVVGNDHRIESADMGKKRTHAAHCAECRAEVAGALHNEASGSIPTGGSGSISSLSKEGTKVEQLEVVDEKSDFVVVDTSSQEDIWQAEISIVGMTCSACVGAITRAVEELSFVRTINVALLTNSATVLFNGQDHAQSIVTTIEDAGFDAKIENLEQQKPKSSKKSGKELWKVEVAISGMTCSACVNSIIGQLDQLPFIENASINLISNSGTIIFEGRDNLAQITESIEDAGFDVAVDKVEELGAVQTDDLKSREVYIKVDDMYCHHCPDRIVNMLKETYGNSIDIVKEITLKDPILTLKYISRPPEFTIRHILSTINSVDNAFVTSIYHPPTIEDRSREMHARERKRILFRLALAVTTAIPAFIIGVVCMSLMMKNSSIRMYMMHPMWAGTVSRAEWALFFLATPIYFFAADTFHRKALKELKALWRPGSKTSLLDRFIRFGSMNMLMSLGTSVAYFSSIAELILEATEKNAHSAMPEGHSSMNDDSHNYFDSVIFLTMFLLLGRFIEAYSKAKTGDAVTALGKLRPTEAILIEETDVAGRKLAIDLLDVGDTVLVQNGASPPYDGIVIDGAAQFDESSLTGESRLVPKNPGDPVYSGTVNKTGPISVKLTTVSGSSMLDQIIKVVREGQAKRAPVERAADIITSHFVPFVVSVGIITWCTWLGLGLGGRLPQAWIEGQHGGWALWALRFAISVFVVACPCGIGLAAPTALFVGGGMAAKNGILVKGGGEAFQEASDLDCIVFDKTGTLTTGGDPTVVDFRQLTDDNEQEYLGMVKRIEENSGHPIAKAVVGFCAARSMQTYVPTEIHEKPGKGMLGIFRLEEGSNPALDVEVLVGNETLMNEFKVTITDETKEFLSTWKRAGNSVVLVALRATSPFSDPSENGWILTVTFAIADALRPEAKFIVKSLQERKIAVWMLSGDNVDTAQAIGAMVGIHKDNIIAGVLPEQKAEKIQYLQKTITPPGKKERALVAMVGDGINDSPALTMADVGIAIGSGSDVAISSAEFVLISSDLSSIITLIDLSRAVFRRVWFNFAWALVYNIIAMPVSAGVFYAIVSNGKHIVLEPVWASLAMALSSISVICSSLLLRSKLPFVGFRPTTAKPQKN
ncbi:heavy metal translocatin [Microthyrium microscopicum]|uniref:Heavy metal translocatin n=1 Tax=Microthyrium microscopicum TaxID=703497 RepID=A0A6A6URJ3_9PEZI|nr:heavy metal translocatin [Microthyrium microscopicum]